MVAFLTWNLKKSVHPRGIWNALKANPCKISNRTEKRRINSFVFPLLFFKMLAKQKRLAKRSASYCSKTGHFLIHNSQFIIDNARKWKFSGGNTFVLPNFRIRQHQYTRVCNSHCRKATKSYCKNWFFNDGNSCVALVSHNLFFSGGNYKFPFFSQPNSEIRQNDVDFLFSAEFLRPFGSKILC